MAELTLAAIGLAAAAFVGLNVGGSSTGVAFGVPVGSETISVRTAALLMGVFVFAGGALVGPNVVDTLGHRFVPAENFTLVASVVLLFLTGLGIGIGNLTRVSVSTSQVAVGAVAGLGLAIDQLNFELLAQVVIWWLVSPMVGFWLSLVTARYFHEPVLERLRRSRLLTETRMKGLVVALGCYMGFSAGASNVANATAPLVGGGVIGIRSAVLVGGLSIGLGALVLGPRTMETVGSEITELPLEAALFVQGVAATTVTGLSALGVPISLAVVAIASVMGYGWGRATRALTIPEALGVRVPGPEPWAPADRPGVFRVDTIRRIVATWIATPIATGGLSWLLFEAAARLGWM